MPTTKTTITITDLQDAAGNLLGNAWLTVRLNAGGNAVEVDGVAVAKTAKVQTDADGDASIQLYPNEAFDVEDTFYTIAVDETSPLIYRTIRVPTGGGTYAWTADAIQVEAVPFDGPYPGGTTGSAGQVVARKSSGNGFELVNHNSIAGRSTADAHPMAAVSATGLTVPKASTIVADWEAVTAAPVSGVSAERIAAMSAVLPLYVTRDGSTAANVAQDQHNVALLALAEAEGARTDLAEVGEAIRTAADVAAEDARSVAPRFTLACAADGDHDTPAYTTDPPGDFTTGAYFEFDIRPLNPTNLDDTPANDDVWYAEIASQTGDGIGLWDIFEAAIERKWSSSLNRWRRFLFFEWTEIGGTSEVHSLSTAALVTTAGVNYPAYEIPAAGGRFAIHLDFENSDGVWQLDFWRRTYEPGGTNFAGKSWVRICQDRGEAPTSIKTGVSYPWAFGYGQGEFEMESLTIRDVGPSGTILAAPTAALAYAEGDGQPFDDPQGNTWTPGADATVSVPSSGALPNNLWAHQIIPWLHWKTSGGYAPTRTPSSSRFTGGYLSFATVGTGHWVEWSVGLDAGTWDLTLIYDKLTVYGVYDVSVDGVVVGSFNANGANATNQVFSIPGITVPANGNHTLRLTNTANGAGPNTAGLALEAIGLQRTA